MSDRRTCRTSNQRKKSLPFLALFGHGVMSDLESPLCAQKRTSSKRSLAADRLQQHGVPVEIQELLLAAGEPAHVDDLCGVDAHSLKRGTMSDRGNDEPAVVFEADEAAIEQMVDARRQQQSVLAVQSLLVGRVAPRLAMARDQMNRIFDAGDPASGFDLCLPAP